MRELKTEEPFDPADPMDPFQAPPPPLRIKSSPSHSEQVEETGGEKLEVRPVEDEGELYKPESSVSSSTACLSGDIDSVVDRHLEEFSADIQLLLQDEGVNYSLPEFSHSSSAAETPQLMLPYSSLPQFSPYVSFFNPCPTVCDYMSSLHDGISGLLAEFEERGSALAAPVDAALADTVSDFVASVRAGKASAGRSDEAADCEAPAAWQPDSVTWRSPPSPRPDPASGSVWGCTTQEVVQPQDDSAARTVLCAAAEEGQERLTVTQRSLTVPGLVPASESQHLPVPSPSSTYVLAPAAPPVPSTTHISSVIDQLEPNVLNNLVEILKDIKRKTPQFYVHCTEPGDPVYEEVKVRLRAAQCADPHMRVDMGVYAAVCVSSPCRNTC